MYKILFCVLLSVANSQLSKGDNEGSSLVFLFDTTGSMHDDLSQLQEGAEMILNTALEESNGITNFVFVPFHDPKVGPATVTTDKQTFKDALNSVKVHGGGDCPEKSVSGLILALNVSLPRSFVYVFTDATAKDHRLTTEVLDAVQRKQTQVVFVLTGHCNDLHKPHYKAYQQIAAASSGQVFNLKKASVHKVLDFVRSSLKGRMVNLGSHVNPPGYNYTHGFPIDSALGSLTVSVSGPRPHIKVMGPGGEEMTPPRLETTLDLAEIMVVKVHDPTPGPWSVTVGSEAEHSVKVTGLSNLTFQHGFSVQIPGSMAETSHRPLQGALNYMLISLSDSRPVSIKSAAIINLEGKVIFEVPLKQMNNGSREYMADAFLPPEDFFYVAINGYDEDNQELRRVAPTAVKAKLPDSPYLEVDKQMTVHAHGQVVLVCRIESLVPVTAAWTKDSEPLMEPLMSLQSTLIEHVISDANDDAAGRYRCRASNVAGTTDAFTDVRVLVDPPMVSLTPENLTVDFGEEVTIRCKVLSESSLKEFRLTFNGTETSLVTEMPMVMTGDRFYLFNRTMKVYNNDTGAYTCHARNRGGVSSKTTFITVLSHPKVEIIGPKVIRTKVNSSVAINCRTENAFLTYLISPSKTVVILKAVTNSSEYVWTLQNVGLNDNGVWICIGEKGGFKDEDNVTIEVRTKPIIIIESTKKLVLKYGDKRDILCKITAYPAAAIHWRKSNGDIINNTVLQTTAHSYESYLVLDNITELQEDTYSCLAENTEGPNEDTVDVKVWKPMTVVEGMIDQATELYSQVELNCKFDAYPKPDIEWYHNRTQLQTNSNTHISLDNATVYINKADFDNFGLYECRAENEYERMMLNSTLTVCCLDAPVLLKKSSKITVLQGHNVTLSTSILKGNPFPKIIWKFLNRSSSANGPESFSIRENGLELIIPNVDIKHEGVYRCVAENIVGSDEYDIAVIVQYPPMILSIFSDEKPIETEVGEIITFPCQSLGLPKPLVTWTKNGDPLGYSDNVYSSNDSLVIKHVGENNSGIYTCNATSPAGSSQKNYSLIVFEKPSIVPPNIDTHQEVLEGQLVELPCFARGIPKPRMEWLQNGKKIVEDRKYIGDDFILWFVANLTDFGEYTCRATNAYGNSSLSYELLVWVPPSIEPPQIVTKEVISGTNVSFECNAVGFPLPEVSWIFRQNKLIGNTSHVSLNDVGGLRIDNTRSKHEGSYTCVAENIAGIAEKTFLLNVNELPKILPENFTGPYIASDMDTELLLPCRVEGRPKPFIAWLRNELFIDKDTRHRITSEGTLVLKSLTEQLSGSYTCIAKNSVGTANRTVEVNIFSMPMMTQADSSTVLVKALQDGNKTIQCPLRSAPGDTVKWYKNAELVATGDLKLDNTSESSTYACVVSNAMGSWQATVEIEVEFGPKFIKDVKKEYTILKGDDLYLDCSVNAKTKAKTKWYFNSKLIVKETREYFKEMNVQTRNSGAYKCVASNEHGVAERLVAVEVVVPPFISEFDLLDVQLNEGTNATLECNANGHPKPSVSWIYNNTNWQLINNTLHTTNTTVDSEGFFKCVSVNEAGRASLVYRVVVIAPAQVDSVMLFEDGLATDIAGRFEVEIDKIIRLSCHANGYPAPDIRWIKNGDTLSRNDNGISYADLTLDGVLNSNSGSYSCTASNEGGIDERLIKLEVLEHPRISTSMFDSSKSNETSRMLEVISGQRFNLQCHPYGNPVPQLYWFKEGAPLKLYDDTMVSTDYGEVIVSDSASRGQSGNYTCVAVNKLGNSSFSYIVDVLVPPPTPKGAPINISVRNGTPLILSCPLQGTPPPEVIWVKGYVELSQRLSHRIRLENQNSTLIINDTNVDDSGEYSCHLTNKVGTSQIIFNVSVAKAPSIAEGGTNYTVKVGDGVALYCDCDGEPTPSVLWYKDATPLVNSNIDTALNNRVLTIRRVETRDATQFVCVAENNAGVAHKRFHLFVKVPGKWTAWSNWSFCNVTCGPGYQERSRSCHYTDDFVTIDKRLNKTASNIVLDESSCKGNANNIRECYMPPCEYEEHQAWSPWSLWSRCSASCGAGTQTRTRKCSSGECHGDNMQIRKCPNLPGCDATNDVFNSREEVTEPDPFVPEAEYDLEPEAYPDFNPDVEEFYVETVEKQPKSHFVKVTENLDRSDRGDCTPGYRHDRAKGRCEDIDECAIENNMCHSTQACANAAGGYSCTCPPGYAALGAGQRCLDINECTRGEHSCEFACVNTAGGYVCGCPPGRRLLPDRRHCALP